MPLDPSQPDEVAPALLEYARGRLGVDDISYLETPAKIGRGFDTHIYSFRLVPEQMTVLVPAKVQPDNFIPKRVKLCPEIGSH